MQKKVKILLHGCVTNTNCGYRRSSIDNDSHFSAQVFDGDTTNDNDLNSIELRISHDGICSLEGIRFFELVNNIIHSGYYIMGIYYN